MTPRVVVVLLGFIGGCSFEGSAGQVLDAAPDAIVDGPQEDAPPDAPMLKCPAGYDVVPGAPATSRYRKLTNAATPAKHGSVCTGEGTHLVVLDSAAETMAIATYANAPTYLWVGVSDAAVETVWLTAKNLPAAYLPWHVGQPDGGIVENCVLLSGLELHDFTCARSYPSVCECD
jgi:hypothetical protein